MRYFFVLFILLLGCKGNNSNHKGEKKDLLQSNVKLEFWETYSSYEINEWLFRADRELKKYLDSSQVRFEQYLDNLEKHDTVHDDKREQIRSNSLQGQLFKENPLLRLFLGGFPIHDNEYDSRISDVLLSDTSKINTLLEMDVVKRSLPKDLKLCYGTSDEKMSKMDGGMETTEKTIVYAIKKIAPLSNKPPLDETAVLRAYYITDDEKGESEIIIQFNELGTKKLEQLTLKNLGRGIAITLNGVVLSAPIVQDCIRRGKLSISGISSKAIETIIP